MTDLQLQSIITCPQCDKKTIEQMPTDYCSYGNVKCPQVQKGECVKWKQPQ